MNFTISDEDLDAIDIAARATFKRHQSGVRGQQVSASDSWDSHIVWATAALLAARAASASQSADERAAFYVHKNAVREIVEHAFDFTQTQIWRSRRSDNYLPVYLSASKAASTVHAPLTDDRIDALWCQRFSGVDDRTACNAEIRNFARMVEREARAASASETGAEGARIADDMRAEQTYLGSCREACDNSGRIGWDRLQRVIDFFESRSPAMAAEAAAIPYGNEFADMDGERHFKRGALPSYAQSNIVPLYTTPQPAQADARVGLTDEQRSTLASLARTSTPYEQEVLRSILAGDAA